LAQERESARKEAWEAFKRKRAEILLMNSLVKMTLDLDSMKINSSSNSNDCSISKEKEIHGV
jgi:hypothetical protein